MHLSRGQGLIITLGILSEGLHIRDSISGVQYQEDKHISWSENQWDLLEGYKKPRFILKSTHLDLFTSSHSAEEANRKLSGASSDGKEPACSAGDMGSIPGLGRPSGEGNGNPLQYSCLKNPTDRGAWWAPSMGLQRVRHSWATDTGQPTRTVPVGLTAHTYLLLQHLFLQRCSP